VVVSQDEKAGHRLVEPIARKKYYSIGDACDLTGLKPHVLRYWETQFDVLHPHKNRAGNRVFLAKDIELILLVKRLLYQEKYTIEGARQKLDEMKSSGELGVERRGVMDLELLAGMKSDLQEVLLVLTPPSSSRGQ
jgi:DNA-binding transcriptional MerR regulator